MRDGATGRSRGFGFLTFKDPRTVNTVMVKEHFLDGKIVRATPHDKGTAGGSSTDDAKPKRRRSRKSNKHRYLRDNLQIDPKRAIPKDEQEKTAKIFVGGVSQEATEADFTGFFAQFGRVIDATLMMDKDTGRPRGFGFVTFDSDTAVERVLDYHPLEILAKPIEVKRAQPRGKMGEEEDFSRGRGGRGKFGGREDRFSDSQSNQNQSPAQGQAGMNGMSPQMMAQYWQRMQQYFQMMQQQMMANAMGNMGNMNMGGQMNPQMMRQMQQMQQMQQNMGGASPNSQNMNPQMQQQMMQMMQMQQQQGQQGGMGNGGGQQRPPSGPQGNNRQGSQGSFSANEQIAFEQQKYEQQARRTNVPHGPRGYQQGPQSWEGMYDDVPQPEGAQGGRGGPARNNTPTGKPPKGPAQPSNAPANAPTGPKIATKPGGGFRGGRGHGRFHPYGRG